MNYQILASGEIILQSWDNIFIDYKEYQKAGEPEGYVWGTNWTLAYPGFSLIENSQKAKLWTEKFNKKMQEIELEAEIIKMSFVFHEWTLKKLNNQTGLISQAIFPLDE